MTKLKVQLTLTGNKVFNMKVPPRPDENADMLDWDDWSEEVEGRVADKLYKEGWNIDDLSIEYEEVVPTQEK